MTIFTGEIMIILTICGSIASIIGVIIGIYGIIKSFIDTKKIQNLLTKKLTDSEKRTNITIYVNGDKNDINIVR